MTTLDDIVRERMESGAYGNAHLVMNKASLDTFRDPGTWTGLGFPQPLTHLLGISVVLDEGFESGHWKLLDNSTKAVLHEGALDRDA